MLRSFIEVAPKLGQGQAAEELKPALKVWETIVGTGNPDSRLLIEPRTVEDQVPRLLLSVPKDHLQVEIDMDDIFIEGPAPILRAICAYR